MSTALCVDQEVVRQLSSRSLDMKIDCGCQLDRSTERPRCPDGAPAAPRWPTAKVPPRGFAADNQSGPVNFQDRLGRTPHQCRPARREHAGRPPPLALLLGAASRLADAIRRSASATGDMQPYPATVVLPVPEAAGGAFHLLDQPVRALGPGVREPGREEHLDRRPPGLDRLGERGQLGDLGVGAPAVERPEPAGGSRRGARRWRRSRTARGVPPSRSTPTGSARSGRDRRSRSTSAPTPAGESRSRPRSSSRRFAHAGSIVRPRRPSSSRVTRWRTAVTALFASMIRWKWSTAIAASGSAARTAAA